MYRQIRVFICSSTDSVGVMYTKLIFVPAKVTTESVCQNILSVIPCSFSFLCLIPLITRILWVFLLIWPSICSSSCDTSVVIFFCLVLQPSCSGCLFPALHSLSISYCLRLVLWFQRLYDIFLVVRVSSSNFLFMFSLTEAISLTKNCFRSSIRRFVDFSATVDITYLSFSKGTAVKNVAIMI